MLAPRRPRTVHNAPVRPIRGRLASGLHDERRNHSFLPVSRDRTDVVVAPGRNAADIDVDVAGLPPRPKGRLVLTRGQNPPIDPPDLESLKIDYCVGRRDV